MEMELQRKIHNADCVLQSLYVVNAMNKFTKTTEVLWRKRAGTATL